LNGIHQILVYANDVNLIGEQRNHKNQENSIRQ